MFGVTAWPTAVPTQLPVPVLSCDLLRCLMSFVHQNEECPKIYLAVLPICQSNVGPRHAGHAADYEVHVLNRFNRFRSRKLSATSGELNLSAR